MKQNHIIHKVLIEINVDNKEKADQIKDNINSFLTMDVFPKLEKYINAFKDQFPVDTLQISRLTLDLNQSKASLDTALKNNIAEQFKKELTQTIKSVSKPAVNKGKENDAHISLLNEEEKWLETFIYFLEKGYMPWWHSNTSTVTILEPVLFKKFILTKAFENRIMALLQKPRVRERIVNQLADEQIKQICSILIKNKNLEINLDTITIQRVSKRTLAERNAIWSLVLNVLTESVNKAKPEEYSLKQIMKTILLIKTGQQNDNVQQIGEEIIKLFPFIKQDQDFLSIKNRFQEIVPEIDTAKVKNQQHKKRLQEAPQLAKGDLFLTDEKNTDNSNAVDENTGYYVQNAGLVLIHPFMKNLFMHCNLLNLETQELIDPELCIHLLHYIATGKTNQPESDMLFEKFLCNVPLQQSISRHIKLSNKHKTHAKKVIEAVQQNWSSMKTASVGLLQNEFFQRPGKLVLDDSSTLTVERKTQDILLEKLPWGVGLIKLPWQKEFIYVNW